MGVATSYLETTDEAATDAGDVSAGLCDPPPKPSGPLDVDQQIIGLQSEVDRLRAELERNRHRDQTLHWHMQHMDEEMRLAARLQRDFLPKTLPQIGRARFHVLFQPAGYVSGDLYDVMRLDEHHVGFFIADAVGHGMPAALLTMFLKRALITKEIISGGYRLLSPGEAMCRLNDALVEQELSQATFATALYGLIDTRTMEGTFARGGHPNPLLLSGDGRMEEIEADGPLLGIFPNETFTEAKLQLEVGHRLFVYSDGFEVAFRQPESDFDPRRWQDELCRRRDMRTDHLLDDFSRHLDQVPGSLQANDDRTMIVIEAE